MKWYVRLLLSVGAALGAAVVAALALTVLDLYLTGHGHPSIHRATIELRWIGMRLSPSDIAFVASALVVGIAVWWLLRLAETGPRPSQVRATHNAEHYTWGSDCDGWHLLKTPGLSVIQERVPPGRREVRHYHARAQQFFYVLAGTATLEVAGEVLEIGPRHGCAVPAKVPHQLGNQGKDDLEFLVISAPASHGDRVEVASGDI